MTNIADLERYAAVEVVGCPGVLISQEILRAARILCERSRIWKDGENTTSVVADTAEVSIAPSTPNANIVSIDYVRYSGDDLTPTTEAEMTAYLPRWQLDTGSPSTHYIPDLQESEIRLYPIPASSASNVITYEITLKPSEDATTLPDWLVDQFREVFIDGALSRLFMMNKVPWRNPEEAGNRRRFFMDGVNEAKDKAIRGIMSSNYEIVSSTLA